MEWVVTDDISSETWSRLLEFANTDVAIRKIAEIHGEPTSSSKRSNYKKQAQQLRSCLLQAQEYFSAAAQSSLITSPNHAYYGMVSLASSCMLLRGDGSKSLDVVRQKAANKNHGLDFSTGVTKSSAQQGLEILSQSYVEILGKGHFPLWYEVLPDFILAYGKTSITHASSRQTRLDVVGGTSRVKYSEISGTKSPLLGYLMFLPDLVGELRRYGVAPVSSRFDHEAIIQKNGTRKESWYIHGAGAPQNLEMLLDAFKAPARNIHAFSASLEDGVSGGIVSFVWDKKDEPVMFQFPSSRVALSFDNVCYADDVQTHEFVDMYVASFGLSMLARYFPDLWVTCLESNCLAAKLIERFAGVLVKKAPMLALSLLSGQDYFISTHRRPWSR